MNDFVKRNNRKDLSIRGLNRSEMADPNNSTTNDRNDYESNSRNFTKIYSYNMIAKRVVREITLSVYSLALKRT